MASALCRGVFSKLVAKQQDKEYILEQKSMIAHFIPNPDSRGGRWDVSPTT